MLQYIPFLNKALDKIFPDKTEAAKAKTRLIELEQQGDLAELDAVLKVALAQARINEEDAKSNSKFQSWWRPAAAWVCVLGLVYPIVTALMQYGLAIVLWFVGTTDPEFAEKIASFPMPPALDTAALVSLLVGMLGLNVTREVGKHNRMTKWEKD